MSTTHPTLTARIDVTLLRGQNNREHHRVRANRVAAEREATLAALAAGDWQGYPVSLRRPELGARVTLIRPYVSTPLDSDNLSAACKAPRDAVAQFLGVDDASARLHWVYRQEPAVVVGRSTKPGRSRASADHDTRPLVRIEVMPVERIDPQAEALAHAEARAEKAEALAREAADERDVYTSRIAEIADDMLGVQPVASSSVALLNAIDTRHHQVRIDLAAAIAAEAREWALGVQVVAQAARLRLATAVCDAARTLDDTAETREVWDALAEWDAVPGMSPPLTSGDGADIVEVRSLSNNA